MAVLDRLDYITIGLPNEEAYAIWKGVVGALFEPRPLHPTQRLPTGSASGAVLDTIIIARVVFGAQSFRRDKDLVAKTPDHFLFHLYNVGGLNGLISGHQATIWPSQVAVIDLGYEVDTLAASSDTISLVVPRALLPGIAGTHLPPKLEPERNRLLAAHLIGMRERSTTLTEAEIPDVVERTVEFLTVLFGSSRAANLIDAPLLDTSYVALAEQAIRNNLASPNLSPETIANEIGVSRATLYRIFAPYGGIMRSVQERRLLAIRAALSDPLETRRLTKLAADFGFSGKVHFSRSFRARFGITASEFRAEQVAIAEKASQTGLDVLDWWWKRLGTDR